MAFQSFHPISIVIMRVIIASAFMLILSLSTKKLQKIKKEHLLLFLGLGLLEPFGYFLCEIYGLKMVSPTFAAVILATIPLFSPFIAYFTLKEKLSAGNILGIVVSLTGVIAISFDGNGNFLAEPLGVILLFAAVFISISYSVAVRKLSKYYNELSIVSYQNISGIILFSPLFFIFDYNKAALPFEWSSLTAVFLLAIFASALAFIFYANSLNQFGVAKTNIFLNLLPAITAFLSVTILGESINSQKVIGIIIVISGLFVSQLNILKSK